MIVLERLDPLVAEAQQEADELRFEGAVAADFDGNGRTDIAFDAGGRWRYSPDATSPLAILNKDPRIPLRQGTIGYFAGRLRPGAAGFDGNQTSVWRGLASGYDRSVPQLR